jgi:hypothetical protein
MEYESDIHFLQHNKEGGSYRSIHNIEIETHIACNIRTFECEDDSDCLLSFHTTGVPNRKPSGLA